MHIVVGPEGQAVNSIRPSDEQRTLVRLFLGKITLPNGRIATLPHGLTWMIGQSLPLVSEGVHCLRRTDSQGRLGVLGRHFTLGAEYRRCDIRATLAVVYHQVAFHNQEAADKEPFLTPLPGPIEAWDASLYLKYLT